MPFCGRQWPFRRLRQEASRNNSRPETRISAFVALRAVASWVGPRAGMPTHCLGLGFRVEGSGFKFRGNPHSGPGKVWVLFEEPSVCHS